MFKVINHGPASHGYDTVTRYPVGLPVVRRSWLVIFTLQSIPELPVTNGMYFWGDKFRSTEAIPNFSAFDGGTVIQYIFI